MEKDKWLGKAWRKMAFYGVCEFARLMIKVYVILRIRVEEIVVFRWS